MPACGVDSVMEDGPGFVAGEHFIHVEIGVAGDVADVEEPYEGRE